MTRLAQRRENGRFAAAAVVIHKVAKENWWFTPAA